jgi:hypothetical protein
MFRAMRKLHTESARPNPLSAQSRNRAIAWAVALTALAFALLRLGPYVRGPNDGQPCAAAKEALHPLLIGDTIHATIGFLAGAACLPAEPRPVLWTTGDTAIVQLSPDGRVIGRATGVFRLFARDERANMIIAEGFVVPRGWHFAKDTDSRTVIRVGDSVVVDVQAVDSLGHLLPRLPFDVFSRDYFLPDSQPVFDILSVRNALAPVVFKALRAGQTNVRSEMGARRVLLHITVLPAR